MEITIEQVREFLATNKETDEVKTFLSELVPEPEALTGEKVTLFLETEDGKALLQPITDRRVDQALKTYRENHYSQDVKKAVAEEMLKVNPQETPEQKQIRELREEMDKERAARTHSELRTQIVEEASRQGVPTWWVDQFSGNTIEEAKVMMQRLKSREEEVKKAVREEMLNGGHKPGAGMEGGGKKIDLSSLTQDQLIQMEMDGKLNDAIGA